MVTKPTWKNTNAIGIFSRVPPWVKVFLKYSYNTGIPSSAAIEHVFSVGSDVMKPKRVTLTSENFERLVFIQENQRCVTSPNN